MKGRGRFLTVIIITLIAGGIVSWHSCEPPLENARFFDFPMTVDGWKGENIPMSDYVYKGIETKYLFLRNYTSKEFAQPVNLSVVWFDDRNLAFHTPESCLGGVGISVADKDTVKMNINGREYNIARMIVDLDGRKELVLYYFDVDGKITTSSSMIRVHTLLRRLSFKRSSASFVRLMAAIEPDEKKTMDELNVFLKSIAPILPSYTHTDLISGESLRKGP